MIGALDLVEAAVRTGRADEAAAHAAAARESAAARLSPRLQMLVLACEALTAPDARALELFERALSLVEPGSWPFDTDAVSREWALRLDELCGAQLAKLSELPPDEPRA